MTVRLSDQIASIIASALRVDHTRVTDDTPFALLGLDSLTAAEITTMLEDELGLELPATLLFDYPTLRALAAFIDARRTGRALVPRSSDERVAAMLRDAVLPRSVAPAGARRATGSALLTGATGFVGAYLLRELLATATLHVQCLVRDGGGMERIRANLGRYGIWDDTFASRLSVITGDLAAPSLGLDPCAFTRLATEIDTVYHAAAAVDWVQPYEGLRDANVAGTMELLRLACTGSPKHFVFLSSLAVCYATQGPMELDESSETLPQLRGLHLGYAQSKCVAEALVREAAARGLPATIVRPALVSGDSRSGASNADDLISRFIRGCIALGAAPDLDWAMDSIPVDHAARAIVSLTSTTEHVSATYHVLNPRPRHWREVVLWMRLRGYPMELLPYDEWASLVREQARDVAHPLHGLQWFFLHRVDEEGGIALPRLYEESRRRRARAERTQLELAAREVRCPPVDAHVLGRYFDDYVARGALPQAHDARRTTLDARRSTHDAQRTMHEHLATLIESGLRARTGDESIVVTHLDLTRLTGDSSIVAELTSWRRGTSAGLYRAGATWSGAAGQQTNDLMVKIKSSDRDVIEVGANVAHLCGPELGRAYERWQEEIGFTHGHLRELAIAELRDPAFVAHTPRPVAVERDDDRGEWTTVVEYVHDAAVKDADDRPWSDPEIDATLRGLAPLHATWLGRTHELSGCGWLPPVRTSATLSVMTPLWEELADHAAPLLAEWGGAGLPRTHSRLVASIASWRPVVDGQPRTLIHNDFNPRNIMLRGSGDALTLCAYDWELATIGAPQRDVVELLCFTLDPATAAVDAPRWLERARRLLHEASGIDIPSDEWIAGARAALNELLIDRISMYVMINRFRPQRFLRRVVRTWMALDGGR